MAAAARANAEPDAQDGLFDQVLEHELLEAALERRQAAKDKNAVTARALKEAHDAAKGMVAGLDLAPDSVVRCGRFRIKTSSRPERHVEFDTSAGVQTRISLIGD